VLLQTGRSPRNTGLPGRRNQRLGPGHQTNDVAPKEKIIRTGLLLTAGLIAGEALMGVIVAFLIIGGLNFAVFEYPPILPSVLVWVFIAALLAYIPLREIYAKDEK